ncbi:TnpA family transposase [Arthrobacter sp. UYNi723]
MTSIRQGTASTEAILRRFTRSASHPPPRRCWKSGGTNSPSSSPGGSAAGICNVRSERLNIVEAFNGANSVISDGKGGEIASKRHDEQEMTVLCQRILQAALVYVNTLMLQVVRRRSG